MSMELMNSNVSNYIAHHPGVAHIKRWIEDDLKRNVADVQHIHIDVDSIEVEPTDRWRKFVPGPFYTCIITFTDASASSKKFPLN